jgi:glucan phosphoethanolaminetransferase (alkaline phosphatase superfamily)
MNDLLAPYYELFFNFDLNQLLLNLVYNNNDYEKFSWGLFSILIILAIFYRVWDPVQSPRLKWFFSLILIGLVMYMVTSFILYTDPDMKSYIGNYNPETDKINPDYFIFKMSMASFVLGFLLSVILSILPFKFFSSTNRHNPF